MKKLLLISALLIFACTDDEGNPCVYEPTLSTEAVTDITETSATLNGVIAIVSENCDVPNNAEQGFVYSTEIQPTLADIQVNVNGVNITTTIEGLTPNTTYYVRAFLTNNFGDFYGDEVSFTTVAGQVVLNTLEVTGITENSAISGGQITSNGNTTIISKGVCWSENQNPTIEDDFINNEDDSTSFQCLIEELTNNTQYYLRSFATNEFGTYYGNELIFTTICVLDFDEDGVCDQEDNDDDNDGVDDSEDCQPFNASIYPGATEIEDGIDNNCDGQIDEGCWSIDSDGDGICDEEDDDDDNDGFNDSEDCEPLDASINPGATELEDGIDNNCDGQIDEDFWSGTVTDQDGNTYDYLTYNYQKWTVENAQMITYRDGTPIPQVTDAEEWRVTTTGAWCYYNNDPTKPRIYNWYAIDGKHDNLSSTPNKIFAPEGWHVASKDEWIMLRNHLIANGYNYDGSTWGNKVGKSMASNTGWISSSETGSPGNNQSLNNSSGFNAFPVGKRSEGTNNSNPIFSSEGYSATYWSSTPPTWAFNIYTSLYDTSRDGRQGRSVRLVRD